MNDLGELERKLEKEPIDSQGNYFKINSNHGEYKHSEDSFTISGIRKEFKCPVSFIWNEELKSCVVKPICESSDAPGTIKGLTYYHEINDANNRRM
ncbi:unnamed protein product [Euphydryas editha]|uniref:Uncharacterized protein n=1 Tax=Euphydryas editha TaxID=104508 RepID=A0AAU9TKI2_EUPED|nr:unnamed protein product [Euphydryas editha]